MHLDDRQVPSNGAEDHVSVVVAAFNEAQRLGVTLERVLSALAMEPNLRWEVIVVDDGSSDGTRSVLEEFSASTTLPVTVVTHPVNRGLVEAMKTGSGAASYDTVAFLDADLSYVPETVGRLVRAKRAAGASVAIASPYMRGGRVANVPFDRLVASRVANWMLSLCAGGRIATFTGMVRAYDRELLRELFGRPPVGEFNTWALAECIRADRTVVEVPAALVWPPDRYAARGGIPIGKLAGRVALVVRTAGYLWASCRASLMLRTGTLVLR